MTTVWAPGSDAALKARAAALKARIERGEAVYTLVLAPDTEEHRNCSFAFLPRFDLHFVGADETQADIEARIAARGYDYVLNFTDWTGFSVVYFGGASTGGPFFTKSSVREAGVRAPRLWAPGDAIDFPVVVKPDAASGSIGVGKAYNHAELTAFCEANAALAGEGGFLIESYIDGPEFTVLVVENPRDPARPFAAARELRVPEPHGVRDYDVKWGPLEEKSQVIFVDERSAHGPDMLQRLVDFIVPVFVRHRLPHYFRFDLRMDRARGELYLLDINPYCGMFYPPDQYHSGDLLIERYYGHDRLVRDLMLCDCAHILQTEGDGLG